MHTNLLDEKNAIYIRSRAAPQLLLLLLSFLISFCVIAALLLLLLLSTNSCCCLLAIGRVAYSTQGVSCGKLIAFNTIFLSKFHGIHIIKMSAKSFQTFKSDFGH